jgi:hypothetical protein
MTTNDGNKTQICGECKKTLLLKGKFMCYNCQHKLTDVCDNDCDTQHCSCGSEQYIKDNQIILGHNPNCGEDSEDELNNFS